MAAAVMNFIILRNDFNGMLKSFSLPLGPRLFDELEQSVRETIKKPDQKMFWNDGSSLCALTNSSDLEAAVHFALYMTKNSNKRPQIEIQFGNPEAANSTAKPEAAANTPNDSVIDRALAAIRGELESCASFMEKMNKFSKMKRKIDNSFDDFLQRVAADALRKADGNAARAILSLLNSRDAAPECTIVDDVQLVMDQARVTRDDAVDALELTGGDVIEAVVFLTA